MRALAAAVFEAPCLPGADRVVVMADAAPDAYAVPGLPGRIVVSTGMLEALDDADREAMLAHESAHLACHHYAFVAVAQLAATCNPLLRPVAAAVAYTIERWADERAATACGDRRQVARAIGKAALATMRRPPRHGLSGAVLGLLGRRRTPLKTAGPVPRRVAALLAERRSKFRSGRQRRLRRLGIGRTATRRCSCRGPETCRAGRRGARPAVHKDIGGRPRTAAGFSWWF
ncbi:M56 family metallopeptidase [Streptomyces sp. NPDC001796]|uniref:M56 family metallopeptidase n=1 Tax=Streptomyces sp. NPDC001796 TaxID=3364609 RepID=UPI0036BDF598